jgi:hypothetical protein
MLYKTFLVLLTRHWYVNKYKGTSSGDYDMKTVEEVAGLPGMDEARAERNKHGAQCDKTEEEKSSGADHSLQAWQPPRQKRLVSKFAFCIHGH